MEEVYVNGEFSQSHNPVALTNNYMGPRSSKRSFSSAVILSLGLLNIFLLVGLITLSVYLHGAATSVSATSSNISSMTEDENHLKANLSTVINKLSSMTEERDLLHTRLTEKTRELERLQSLSKQKKTCASGWRMFSCSCYFLSEKTGSWDEGRSDCRDRGADLVVIDSSEEQDFLVSFIQKPTWIGLNDKEEEGRWKWVDGTPLSFLTYWRTGQPDNGGGDPQWGEEDCVHIRTDSSWNDLSCGNSLPWVCEKLP
ncbi:CD209 antigen-like protein E isoform X1 [Oreochromis aureus]|uniref:C-type lectin domain-containing protein n=1 Tax=Oreochromis aureus TaxID=47969 RepID=A0AAZ1Y3T3_OREAU|nr:CD209 antigen-like protein E isoform X1 [Oreochromis aureus]